MMNINLDPWVWVQAIGMIAIFSFIFAENPIYRFFEHVYVGAGAGYAIALNIKSIVDMAYTPIIKNGRFILIIPVILGILLYARFFKSIAWISRWSMAFLVGVGAGISIYGGINSQFVVQVRTTMLPLNTVNNFIMVFGVLSILFYFFFSIEQRGPVKYISVLGRWVMMVTFGVSFGNVVMGRIALLLGSLQDLLGTWLGVIS